MPGPCNRKKGAQKQRRPSSQKKSTRESLPESDSPREEPSSQPIATGPPDPEPTATCHPPHDEYHELYFDDYSTPDTRNELNCPPPLPRPFIEDPGNGPRVRDAAAFLESYFAHGPSQDPLCAEFAQVEILEMLRTVLPEEMALVLWYNKSRAVSRICPACQRLYNLGQILSEHGSTSATSDIPDKGPKNPQLLNEQTISGLCSPVCFILASYGYPENVIKLTWGRTANQLDTNTWTILNEHPSNTSSQQSVLGLLVKMTRLPDLGLAQLCLPDVEFDDEGRPV